MTASRRDRRRVPASVPTHGLSIEIANGIAWLRLERPSAGNRITQDLAQALCSAAEDIELNDRVRIVVLTAAGPSFCVGVENGGEWEQRVDWIAAIARLTRPVVAAIRGDAIAEGFELALACDLRVVSTTAHFALPYLAEGRLPSHGATQRLPRIAGRTRALDLLLTGRMIDAQEAEALRLVTRLVAPQRFTPVLQEFARDLAGKGPLALRYAKEAVLKGADLTLEQGIRLEEDLYVLLQTTSDRKAGVRAFLQKRRPTFRGR
jgi:enoyl-CoA hydratase